MIRFALAATVALAAGSAEARVTHVRETPDDRRCYVQVYVPQRVAVNPRARMVRPEMLRWETIRGGRLPDGSLVPGTMVALVRHPAVFVESRRVIAQDFYTLQPVPCPAR